MKVVKIVQRLLTHAYCSRCGMKFGKIGLPECFDGKEQYESHTAVVPVEEVIKFLKY